MIDVFSCCPTVENDKFLLRLVSEKDVGDLLEVYSDAATVRFFNSDNCTDDFHYTSAEQMRNAILFWIREYRSRYYVRWAVVDKSSGRAIGTIELFRRESKDAYDGCGLLRLDLRRDCERSEIIFSVLDMIIEPGWEWFGYERLATKAISLARERISALEQLGFTPSRDKLVGGDGQEYDSYFVLKRGEWNDRVAGERDPGTAVE